MKLETSFLEEIVKVKLESGAVNSESVCPRFTSLEQQLWNSGQEIRRVLSLYDRFHFKFEDFT